MSNITTEVFKLLINSSFIRTLIFQWVERIHDRVNTHQTIRFKGYDIMNIHQLIISRQPDKFILHFNLLYNDPQIILGAFDHFYLGCNTLNEYKVKSSNRYNWMSVANDKQNYKYKWGKTSLTSTLKLVFKLSMRTKQHQLMLFILDYVKGILKDPNGTSEHFKIVVYGILTSTRLDIPFTMEMIQVLRQCPRESIGREIAVGMSLSSIMNHQNVDLFTELVKEYQPAHSIVHDPSFIEIGIAKELKGLPLSDLIKFGKICNNTSGDIYDILLKSQRFEDAIKLYKELNLKSYPEYLYGSESIEVLKEFGIIVSLNNISKACSSDNVDYLVHFHQQILEIVKTVDDFNKILVDCSGYKCFKYIIQTFTPYLIKAAEQVQNKDKSIMKWEVKKIPTNTKEDAIELIDFVINHSHIINFYLNDIFCRPYSNQDTYLYVLEKFLQYNLINDLEWDEIVKYGLETNIQSIYPLILKKSQEGYIYSLQASYFTGHTAKINLLRSLKPGSLNLDTKYLHDHNKSYHISTVLDLALELGHCSEVEYNRVKSIPSIHLDRRRRNLIHFIQFKNFERVTFSLQYQTPITEDGELQGFIDRKLVLDLFSTNKPNIKWIYSTRMDLIEHVRFLWKHLEEKLKGDTRFLQELFSSNLTAGSIYDVYRIVIPQFYQKYKKSIPLSPFIQPPSPTQLLKISRYNLNNLKSIINLFTLRCNNNRNPIQLDQHPNIFVVMDDKYKQNLISESILFGIIPDHINQLFN